jgi:hypothetical protein
LCPGAAPNPPETPRHTLWSSHFFSSSILLERPKVANVCVPGHRTSSPDTRYWSGLILGICRLSKSTLFKRILSAWRASGAQNQ